MKVAAVILAAGASQRLGEPKQLAVVAGERLLDRAVRVAAGAGCEPVIVVLGASAEVIQTECRLDGARIVMNPEWREGMASSIRHGMLALDQSCDAAILMTCDQPAVSVRHLEQLKDRCTGTVVASSYAGKRGVPVCFPANAFGELMRLQGDGGARHLLDSAETVALDGGELDIDTPLTLAAARSLYAG